MHRALVLTSAITLGLAACSDPAADKPRAEVGPAASVPAAAAAPADQASVRKLRISPETSKIGFIGSKVTGSHNGGFGEFTGVVELAPGAPVESGRVSVEIDMGSVETDTDRLTSHLKTGDFFLVEEFPKASFASTAIEPAEQPGATHKVTGDLTLRGVTKSITFPATVERDGESLVVKSEFAINRKEFGIAYPGKPDDLIRDDVVIQLDLRTEG